MQNDSTIRLNRALEITVNTPAGETRVRLTRLSAQILAAALRTHSGVAPKGVELNARAFNTVGAEVVRARAKTPPVVRLGAETHGVRHKG